MNIVLGEQIKSKKCRHNFTKATLYCFILFPFIVYGQEDHAPYIFQHYEQDAGWKELNIQGKVKLISEQVYKTTSKDGKVIKVDEKPEDIDSLWFDKTGKKLKEELHGLIPYIEKHTFDTTGKQIEFYLMRVETVREIIRHVRYKYDSAGKVVLWDEYYGKAFSVERSPYLDKDSAMEHSREVFKYNKKGQEIEVDEITPPYLDYHDHQTKIDTNKYLSEYDSIGNEIKHTVQTPRGITSMETCKYDDKHRLTERSSYGLFSYNLNRWKDASEGYELQTTESFKYDSNTNITEKIVTYPVPQTVEEFKLGGQATSSLIWKYKYDSKNNLIRNEKYDNYNHLISYNIAMYDDKNNITEEEYFVASNAAETPKQEMGVTYKVENDKEGNWIKKITINSTENYIVISKRTIIYY